MRSGRRGNLGLRHGAQTEIASLTLAMTTIGELGVTAIRGLAMTGNCMSPGNSFAGIARIPSFAGMTSIKHVTIDCPPAKPCVGLIWPL
jgi:hypothetical protein